MEQSCPDLDTRSCIPSSCTATLISTYAYHTAGASACTQEPENSQTDLLPAFALRPDPYVLLPGRRNATAETARSQALSAKPAQPASCLPEGRRGRKKGTRAKKASSASTRATGPIEPLSRIRHRRRTRARRREPVQLARHHERPAPTRWWPTRTAGGQGDERPLSRPAGGSWMRVVELGNRHTKRMRPPPVAPRPLISRKRTARRFSALIRCTSECSGRGKLPVETIFDAILLQACKGE